MTTSPESGLGDRQAPTPDGLHGYARTFAFLALALSVSMAVLGAATVTIALPAIAEGMAVEPATAVWVVTAYQLSLAVCLLPFASLGELVGYRRVYCLGLALFTLASLGCYLSESLWQLIAARVLQGVGAGGITSLNMALIRFIYPRALLGRGVGNAAVAVAMATAAGPTLAAGILAVTTWPWLFLVNVPLGCIALMVALGTLPDTPRRSGIFDWTSTFLNMGVFVLLAVAVDMQEGSRSGFAVAALIGSVATASLLLRRQSGRSEAMLPVALLRHPVYLVSLLITCLAFTIQMLSFVSLPFYFHDVLGYSVVATGLLLMAWPIGVACSAFVAGRLADRLQANSLTLVGLAVLAAGTFLVAGLPAAPTDLDIIWRLVICGIGFGLFHPSNNKILMMLVPRDRAAIANGLQGTMRVFGQATGAALVTLAFGSSSTTDTPRLLVLAGGIAVVGSLGVLLRGLLAKRVPPLPGAGM